MAKATDMCLKSASVSFDPLPFRIPLQLGSRVVEKSTLINVEVVVESRDGKRHATGYGSLPLGNVWAWPSESVTAVQTEAAMKAFAEEVVELASLCRESEHPVDLVYHISAEYQHLARQLSTRMKLAEPMPKLAQLVAASSLDAALHDAYGRLHSASSYDLLSQKYLPHDLSEYLDKQFAGEYLDQYVSRAPQARLAVSHWIGLKDPLTAADVAKKSSDGLPDSLTGWVSAERLTHFRIALTGADLQQDLARIQAIEAAISQARSSVGSPAGWHYTLDLNERCPSAEALVEFLQQLRAKAPAAYDRVQSVVQPAPRDLERHPEFKVHAAAALKPIVIDESLTDYDSLLLARDLGYNGAALRTCKGQTDTLLLGAACQKLGLLICVHDLTCPGVSFLHSAGLAARLPTVTSVEGQARQYCPAANKPWSREYPGLFELRDGTIDSSLLAGLGLGY